MQRIAFTMQVDPAHHQEYIKRHNPIWKELEQVLQGHGVISYSIFLDPGTSILFAYAEIESLSRWQSIAGTEVYERWWGYMSEIMPSKQDGTPISSDLKEVYHLQSGNRR